MRTVPQKPRTIIEFAEAHQPVWEVDPSQIGLTAAQTAELYEQTKLARAAYDRAIALRDQARAATADLHTQAALLRAMTAGYVATIKAFAAGGGGEGYPEDQILAIAQIDPPASPGSALPSVRQSVRYGDAPGKPTDVTIQITPTGAVRLTWTAQGAAASTGAFFTVTRRLAGEKDYSILGTSPGLTRARRRAQFIDEAIPIGTSSVQYRITGTRGRAKGPSSEIIGLSLGTTPRPLTFTV